MAAFATLTGNPWRGERGFLDAGEVSDAGMQGAPDMSREEVVGFFQAYRDAFNSLNGDAVAELWHVPSGITDRRSTVWWTDDAPMRANHHALCDIYRGLNYGRADPRITAFHPLGEDHAFADVRWTLRRQDGSILQQFGTGYHLIRGPQGPQVLLCTAYEEDYKEMTPHAAV